MKKKVMALFLTAALAVACMSGCGNNTQKDSEAASTEASKSTEAASSVAEADSNFNEEGYPIVNEPTTISVMLIVNSNYSYMPINEMEAIKDLEEMTGIHVEWEIVNDSDKDTKINLAFSSGEYPDVIMGNMGNDIIQKYGVEQGFLIPLDEGIEKYMPNYTSRRDAAASDPNVYLVANDGKTYAIGRLAGNGERQASQSFYMKKSWLEAVGKELPKTLDEMVEVLKAFKTQDPNGNGKADEVPFEFSINSGGNMSSLFALFGLPVTDLDTMIYLDNDGQVQCGANTQNFRDAMEWMHLLYAEGLVDPEVLSQDENTSMAKIAEGNAGLFSGWRKLGMAWSDWADDMELWIPPTGAMFSRGAEVPAPYAVVTNKNKDLGVTLRWFDAMMDTLMQERLFHGEEGTEWEYNEDGMMVTIEGVTVPSVMPRLDTNGLYYCPGYMTEELWVAGEFRIERRLAGQLYDEAGIMQKYSNSFMSLAKYSEEQIERKALITTDLKTAISENIASFVANGVSDSAWEEYTKLLDDIGVEELVQICRDGMAGVELD